MSNEENPVNKLIKQLEDVYNKQHKVMADKLEQEFPTPMTLKEFPKKSDYEIHRKATLGSSTNDWWKVPSYWDRLEDITSVEKLDERREKIKSLTEQYIKDCQEVYDFNLPAIQNNKAIVDKVSSIMRGLGVKDTYQYSYFKTNRSTHRTTETKSAGYFADLERTFKTSQLSVPKFTDVVGHYFDGYNSKYEELKRTILDKQRKEEQERIKKEQEHGVALLRAKYTPDDAMSEASDILEGLLSKCKYLRLAHYLEKNRNCWSDGYDYAECGISGFDVETEEDKEIEAEIQGIIDSGNSSGDIDGRRFRDCKYSYEYLYDKVDSGLMSDYEKVKAYIGSDDY